MPHIDLHSQAPGIVGLFEFRPETARPLSELAEVLLRADNSLTRAERELIAMYVSRLNGCGFCERSHATFASLQMDAGLDVAAAIAADPESAPVSEKLRALLNIASKVQHGGLSVTEEDVSRARLQGATDLEIHDTVLIAAAFCMYNRYVDGLATFMPTEQRDYEFMARMIVDTGYVGVLES